MNEHLLFVVPTPLGFRVRVTRAYWDSIVAVKHPVMGRCQADVQDALRMPDEIRRSRKDPAVLLFYRAAYPGRWIVAVAKRLNDEGFLITAYPTDAIKMGAKVWIK